MGRKKERKLYIILFLLTISIGVSCAIYASVEIFDIKFSQPERVYYEPDQPK